MVQVTYKRLCNFKKNCNLQFVTYNFVSQKFKTKIDSIK